MSIEVMRHRPDRWDFACYIALFPQLIAGPIIRYHTIANQLVNRSHSCERFASGAALFVLGFSKKDAAGESHWAQLPTRPLTPSR